MFAVEGVEAILDVFQSHGHYEVRLVISPSASRPVSQSIRLPRCHTHCHPEMVRDVRDRGLETHGARTVSNFLIARSPPLFGGLLFGLGGVAPSA